MHDKLEAMTGINIHDLQVHRHLPSLGQPGLIVHDMDDRDVPWAEGERYARHWHGARLYTTQGLGHHKVLDAPEVIEASLAFLRGENVGERVVSSPNLPFGDS
jgi:pimeloyl-ACP methyl ester carboxylesterase